MTEVAKKSWGQAPTWMKLLFVLSLVGNAAVVGIVGGHMLNDRDWKPEPGLTRFESRLLQMVPDARKADAKAILLKDKNGETDSTAAFDAAQDEILAALRADPFSADRLTAAMQAQRQAWSDRASSGYSKLAEIAAILTPAERGQMADAMQERFERWSRHRRGEK